MVTDAHIEINVSGGSPEDLAIVEMDLYLRKVLRERKSDLKLAALLRPKRYGSSKQS